MRICGNKRKIVWRFGVGFEATRWKQEIVAETEYRIDALQVELCKGWKEGKSAVKENQIQEHNKELFKTRILS